MEMEKEVKKKRRITQFIMLGVMLLLMVLIVSMYPEPRVSQALSHKQTAKAISKLSIRATRAD